MGGRCARGLPLGRTGTAQAVGVHCHCRQAMEREGLEGALPSVWEATALYPRTGAVLVQGCVAWRFAAVPAMRVLLFSRTFVTELTAM